MWALLLAALAQAGTPANIRLDDIEKWEDAAEQLLDMPSGCWEWVGQASWDWHTGKYGKTRGDAVFAGKTVDGDWGEIALQSLGELQQKNERDREQRVYADQARFVPMVGRLPGGRVVVSGEDEAEATIEDAEALNVLRQVLRRVGGEAFTSWAEWDEARGGVVLNRAIPLASNRKEEVKVEVFFPNGGDVPSQLDVKFPKKFKAALRGKDDDTQLGKIRMGLFAFTIKNAEVHIRGLVRGNRVYPSSEAFRFRFGFLGFKYHGAQTVVYKSVTRCAPDEVPSAGITAPPAAEGMVQAGTEGGDDGDATSDEPGSSIEVVTPGAAGAAGASQSETDDPAGAEGPSPEEEAPPEEVPPGEVPPEEVPPAEVPPPAEAPSPEEAPPPVEAPPAPEDGADPGFEEPARTESSAAEPSPDEAPPTPEPADDTEATAAPDPAPAAGPTDGASAPERAPGDGSP